MVCFQSVLGINSESYKIEYKQRIELMKCSYENIGLENGSSFVSFRCVMRAHSSFLSSIRLHFYFRSLYSLDWCQRLSAVAAVGCVYFFLVSFKCVYCCTYTKTGLPSLNKDWIIRNSLMYEWNRQTPDWIHNYNKSIKNGRTAHNLIFYPYQEHEEQLQHTQPHSHSQRLIESISHVQNVYLFFLVLSLFNFRPFWILWVFHIVFSRSCALLFVIFIYRLVFFSFFKWNRNVLYRKWYEYFFTMNETRHILA